MAIRAIVFDLDDTLIIEEATARASLRGAAALLPEVDPHIFEQILLAEARCIWRAQPHHPVCVELGIASWEGLWSDFDGCHPMLDSVRDWSPGYRQHVWTAALIELGVNDAALASAMSQAYVNAQRSGHPLIDGAADTVRAYAGSFRLGLLTNGPADIQRLKLARTGLADCFDTVVISGQLGAGKPNPKTFEVTLDQLGVSPPEAIMIGDSWERDIKGAVAIGMNAIWVAHGRVPEEDGLPVQVIDTVSALSL